MILRSLDSGVIHLIQQTTLYVTSLTSIDLTILLERLLVQYFLGQRDGGEEVSLIKSSH